MGGGEFTGANFNYAALTGATATAASFVGATFNTANLEYAILKDADFSSADMTRGTFTGADIRDALFQDSMMRYSNLGWVNIWGADFTRADLQDSFITSSLDAGKTGPRIILRDADLRRANLRTFWEFLVADSRGAKLSGALMPNGTTHP